MNSNQPAIRRNIDLFYKLLHCRQRSAFETRIIRTIRRALSQNGISTLPIRLKPIAGEFSIDSTPRIDPKLNSFGRIAFQKDLGQFVISLGTGKYKQSPKRLRFTYAHEFAHRFFYIPKGDVWIRASEEIARNINNTPLRLEVMTTLSKIEEVKCNRIAGEILVPREALHEIAFNKFPNNVWVDSFPSILLDLSDYFYVSRECVLRCLGNVDFPLALKSWIAFLVAFSSEKFHGGLGDKKLRIYSMTGIRNPQSKRLFYPGISVDHFGTNFSDYIHHLWQQRSIEMSTNYRNQVILTDKTGTRKHICQLSAALFNRLPEKTLLVWGTMI